MKIQKKNSKTMFSDRQYDMRDIASLMPSVVEINCAIDQRSDEKVISFLWTEIGIQTLRERLLTESVRSILDKRCSQKTWDDVTAWLNSDDDENPFSFVRCVIDVMSADPERYRAAVFDLAWVRNPKWISRIH